jgi:glycosyltransferase involved in cell wall biosynthesis
MKVSVLIPTAGRPELLGNMLSSLDETTFSLTREIETVFVIDGDEDSENVACGFFWYSGKIIDVSEKKRGALWAWNRALQLSSGDIIVPAGDDHIFHEGWLDYALESHEKQLNGYGVVGMNDLAYDGNTQLATMFLFDRKYCKEVMGGIFAPPMYHYYCIDSEWNAKAKMLGHFYWDERSIQEHIHSAHGKREIDELDREKMDAGWMEIDNQTFADRQARGFPIEWEPLI